MTRDQLKPVAEAIANQRLMRNGCPAMTNPLDFISSKPRLVDEVYEDAEAAVKAWIQASNTALLDAQGLPNYRLASSQGLESWLGGKNLDGSPFNLTHERKRGILNELCLRQDYGVSTETLKLMLWVSNTHNPNTHNPVLPERTQDLIQAELDRRGAQ